MELVISKTDSLSEKEMGLTSLPLASSYAKEAIVNQRKRINEIILANMDKSYPAIELPFGLFSEIEQEMKEYGWCRSDGGWYHPIWLNEVCATIEIKDEENKVISAETFYSSTMKRQLVELHTAIENAREKGLNKVHLKFPLYKVIEYKLRDQGWNVYVNKYFAATFPPDTSIIPK